MSVFNPKELNLGKKYYLVTKEEWKRVNKRELLVRNNPEHK
jgi:hypothetical protein